MSATWYECKVKYRKTQETGEQKVVTEAYLLDAISYTEAEARVNEEMASYTSEEFKITNIKVANFAEIHPVENSDRWYKSKVSLIAFDEESGKERKSNIYILVQGNDLKEAFDNTISAMEGTTGDYTIPSITESPIMDVFPYFSGEDDQLEQIEQFNALKDSTTTVVTEDSSDLEELTEESIITEAEVDKTEESLA